MGRDKDGGGLIGRLGKGVAFATEYSAHRKEINRQRSASSQQSLSKIASAGPSNRSHQYSYSDAPSAPPAYEDAVASGPSRSLGSRRDHMNDEKAARASTSKAQYNYDREDDDLDDASWRPTPATREKSTAQETPDELVMDTMAYHPRNKGPRARLPCPVIIPQRRPGSKKRGFLRAYAPVLEPCGIDQATFLAFLKNFHKYSQASPWFAAVQASAGIAGFAPSAIAMAVTTVVGAGAKAGAEMHGRYKTNDFLNKINKELFQPAGLCAVIMEYKPDQYLQPGRMNSSGQGGSRKMMGGAMSNLQITSGTTRGNAELPRGAPLIYPDTNIAYGGSAEETFKDKTKDFKKFLGNYMDKNAQTQYASNNPDSRLAVPGSQRNSDAYSGGYGRRNLRASVSDTSAYNSRRKRRSSSSSSSSNSSDDGKGGARGGMKGMMKESILYLMIMNLPSEGEMREAAQQAEMDRGW